jgi:hypothetical protein
VSKDQIQYESVVAGKWGVDVYEGMPHAFSLSTLDEGHPTGRTLLDRVGDWVREHAAA